MKKEVNKLQLVLENNGNKFKDEKLRNQIEKTQLSILKKVIHNIHSLYSNKVNIEYESIDDIRKHNNQWCITYEGDIVNHYDANVQHSIWYDSRTFDAIVELSSENGEKKTIVFFILKGVQNAGGHQDGVKKEIGSYSKCIQKNKNEDYKFVFLLDGEYILSDIEKLDISDKYYIASSYKQKENVQTINEVITKIFEELC